MRVTRILFILIVLCVAVPAGIALYGASQAITPTSEQTLGGNLPQISDAQLEQIAAAQGVTVDELRATMAERLGAFRQGGLNAINNTQRATSLALLGTVEANEVVSTNFTSTGDVAEVLVKEGDNVSAGDVLARLDTTAAQRAVDDARLSLEDAQIALQTLLEPPSETDIEQARLGVISAQASYSDVANSASDTQLASAELRVQQAQEAYDLAVQKRANMNGTPEELALQEAAIGAASFNLEIARLNLENLQTPSNQGSLWSAGARVQIAELQYEQALNGASESQITSAELNVQNAQLALTRAENALAEMELIAAIDGIVTALNITPGTSVTPTTAAVEITDVSTLWLTASLHELDLDQVREGMIASVTFDALPDATFPATLERIDWIGVEADGIVEYTVHFAVQADDERVRPGMTGEVTLDLTQSL